MPDAKEKQKVVITIFLIKYLYIFSFTLALQITAVFHIMKFTLNNDCNN